MRQAKYGLILLPLFFLLACVSALAQANSEVTGIVTDQTGAVVSGANIALTDPATGGTHTTVSSSTGLYAISGLNAANYNLKVTAKGFQTYAQNGIVVNISATFRVDVKLTIGTETQTVTVEADALAVQSDSNVVSTLINEQQITDLPTNGRNIVALASLGLGVSNNLPDSNAPTSVGSTFSISFNGLNWTHNIYMIDGGEAYDRGSGGKFSLMPSQDALGEFQLLASNYPPDYGISSGGTVTMSLKSGTQKFHGEAWEFVRNDDFDAHNYFDTNSSTGAVSAKPELRYNVFGMNLGGPVFIPHVYNSAKKKTFFFYNEEWRKMVKGTAPTPVNTVPAADDVTTAANFNYVVPAFNPEAQRAAGVGKQIFVPTVADAAFNAKLVADGLTPGQPFPNNKIYANLLDANALRFNATGAIPAATNASSDTATVPGKQPTNVREELFRIDHNINDKWMLLGHFIHDAVSQNYATTEWGSDNYATVGTAFSNPSYAALIKLTGSLTPDVLLEAQFNYDGNKIMMQPTGTYLQPTGWSTGSYFTGANVPARMPDVSLTTFGSGAGYWGVQNRGPWKNGAEDYGEIVNLSVTKGKHALKFGGGYNRYTKNQIIGTVTQGVYTFSDNWGTSAPTGSLTGDSYLDFLLGLSTTFSQSASNPTNHYVNQTTSIYAQDNWHISNRLSVQYGIRYDAMPRVWERANQVSNFDPSTYQTGLLPTFTSAGAFASTSAGLQTINGATFYMNGVVIAGQSGVPSGLVKNDYKTYQPRIGFSYDLNGNGKTVLRGGFGTFFERVQGNDIYDTAGAAPFVNTPSATNVEYTNPNLNWQSGATASSPLYPAAPTALKTTYPAPGVAQYSLGVQHELAPALIWTTQYVGNIGWHQNIQVPINNFPLSTSLTTRAAYVAGTLNNVSKLNAVTYPGFGAITQITNEATSSYNALQTGLRQQGRHGLSFEVDYTWSHEEDSQASGQDVTGTVSNPWNLKYDKGSGVLDRRQILSINYEYKLPFFAHASSLVHSVLGGWEIAGTVVAETGMPWAGNASPASGYGDTIGLGGGYTNRANLTGKVKYPKKKDSKGVYQWVSNSAFSEPIAAWNGGSNLGFGNAPKDAVKGPGRTNFSTSVYKSFALPAGMHFEFRADSFNTFNHTQFNAFNSTVSSSTFGEVTSTQDPRVFEFGGKFTF
jgi:hypothetical protein